MVFGINGFGRIGRMILRICVQRKIKVCAINDPNVDVPHMAYMLTYDSVHGKCGFEVKHEENCLIVNGQKINVYALRDPAEIPWGKDGVDVVMECTGVFLTKERASGHIKGGAKKVIISAPSTDAPTFVFGGNHDKCKSTDVVISNASCTTNCLVPFLKVMSNTYGVEEGTMTTVHSYTATQMVVDGPSRKNWRDGRAAATNIIPSTTGAAKAVAKVLPEFEGIFSGCAFRVPTPNVSVVYLNLKLKKQATMPEIIGAVQKAVDGELKGILGISTTQAVSSDFIGDEHSSTFDPGVSQMVTDKMGFFVLWYDNEFGFSYRMVDMGLYLMTLK